MAAWIAFWTAAWVGSAWLYQHFLTWLTGHPTGPEEQPKKTEATEDQAQDEGEDAGEDQDEAEQPPAEAPATPRRNAGGVLGRLLVLFLAAGFIHGLPHTGDILLTLAACWAVTSVIAGLAIAMADRPDNDQKKEPEEKEPEPPGPDPAETLTRDDIAPLLHGLLQATGGVHLKALKEVLPVRPKKAPWATRDVRALLTRLEVRVRPGVRVPGESGREGVHRDDVPPLPRPTSETTPVAVVVPGQSNNNNDGNSPGYSIEDDPDNPARHTVTHTVIHAERT